MDIQQQTRHSKFLSLVLRHRPELAGITLEEAGWVSVDVLLEAIGAKGHPLNREALEEIVRESPKQRFAFSEDGLRIRANQGHSVAVDLGLQPAVPPERLFHGTVAGALSQIMREGLQKQQRHHVHLSADRETAAIVGSRRGVPVILEVDSQRMHQDGFIFFRAANGVWLTGQVPPPFLSTL